MHYIIICLLMLSFNTFALERDLDIKISCKEKNRPVKYRLLLEEEGGRVKVKLKLKGKTFIVSQKLYGNQRLSAATVDTFDRFFKMEFDENNRLNINLPYEDIVEISYTIEKNGTERIFTPEVYKTGADRLELTVSYNLKNNRDNVVFLKKQLDSLKDRCKYKIKIYTDDPEKLKLINGIFKQVDDGKE